MERNCPRNSRHRTSEGQRRAILVEPGAHIDGGHYQEKLSLWVNGLRKLGYDVEIFSWLPASNEFLTQQKISFNVGPPWERFLAMLYPKRLKVLWIVYRTYFRAFKCAKNGKYLVIGLTTSSPIPVFLASWSARFSSTIWAQLIMYANFVSGIPIEYRVTPMVGKAIQELVARGCRLLCNTELTSTAISCALKMPKEAVQHLPDPIFTPVAVTSPNKKWHMENVLLIQGLDDSRRSPITHLAEAMLTTPIDQLIVHHTGRERSELEIGMHRGLPTFILRMSFLNEYLQTNAEFANLFAAAKFTLIAYSPKWLQASGNLAASIVSGTPVLCSHFPYSDFLFTRYGLIGEQFEYNNSASFGAAWERLVRWSQDQWSSFDGARKRLTADVSSGTIVARAVQALHEMR